MNSTQDVGKKKRGGEDLREPQHLLIVSEGGKKEKGKQNTKKEISETDDMTYRNRPIRR